MAYNPLRDPQSSYNNPKKGPRSSGAPGGGIPLRGPLSPDQKAWMKKGRKKGDRVAAGGAPLTQSALDSQRLYAKNRNLSGDQF